jgi:predicted glycosyltransferase
MDTPRSLSVLSYAVNGSGLGHLTRLVAINRWIRRYGLLAGTRTQHWFLTTSEADSLLFAEGFASFKMPSKSVVEEAGISKVAYLALAKQWVWHSVGLLRPDVLLVDTFPNGSFGELLGVLDLCRTKVLVLRPVKEEVARRPSFKAVAGLYDRIVVPEHRDGHNGRLAEWLEVPPGRLRYSGPVMVRERCEARPRAEARAALGVPGGSFCLLASGGGGGDAAVRAHLESVLRLVADDPGVHVVLAAGPLHRGAPLRGPRVTWWTQPGLSSYLAGVDGAVCAAGFNTAHELLFAGVPTVFLPQGKVADDQEGRVQALVDAGAALVAHADQPEGLREALAGLRDPSRAAALREAARRSVPGNHARDAAEQVLSLVLPAGVLRHAVEAVDDALLARVDALGATLPEVVEAAVALVGDDTADRAALDLEPALELLAAAGEAALEGGVAVRVAALLGRKVRVARPDPGAVAEAARVLLLLPALRGQWSGLVALLRLLATERELGPRAFAGQVAEVVNLGAHAGLDVYGLVRLLGEVQEDPGAELPVRVLLERARARLQAGTS